MSVRTPCFLVVPYAQPDMSEVLTACPLEAGEFVVLPAFHCPPFVQTALTSHPIYSIIHSE